MDCPICNAGMEAVVVKESTTGWRCRRHGEFKVACSCGILAGQEHDILCKVAHPELKDLYGDD